VLRNGLVLEVAPRFQARESLAHRGEILDRVDLPREVIEARSSALWSGRLGTDREQTEVVVVLGVGRA